MKKFILIIILIVFFIVLAVWSPWYKWNFNIFSIFGFNKIDSFSSLKVKALQDQFEIYLDDTKIGDAVSSEGYFEYNEISPGEHIVKLIKDNNHYQFIQKIFFEKDMEVVIGYDLGPTQDFSEGHVLFTRKNYFEKEKPNLKITSEILDIEVFVDDQSKGKLPLDQFELDISKQHTIKLIKDNYDQSEITILSDKQEERDKLKEYDLYLQVNLFLRPIPIE